MKSIERYRARERGEEMPPYSEEELEELHPQDVETVGGRSAAASYRQEPGWQTPEAQELLDWWEAEARRRLAKVEELGEEEWHLAYEEDC